MREDVSFCQALLIDTIFAHEVLRMTIAMQRIIVCLLLALSATKAIAADNPVIFIEKSDRTDSSIVVRGITKIIPSGTNMSVMVVRYNGAPITDKLPIKTVGNSITANDGTFVATLKKYGSRDRFDFPDGEYELEFFAVFNRVWQSIDVLKRAGVKLDNQGRSGIAPEPHSLAKSSDLVAESSFGEMGRSLRTRRTISVSSANSSFKTAVKSMRDPRLDIDLVGARVWLLAAENEMKKARALMSNSQTDAMIGTQSRRIQSIKDQGLSIFPMNPNWNECRAVAADMWPLWWYGYRGKHEGYPNATQYETEYGLRFLDSVFKCQKILG